MSRTGALDLASGLGGKLGKEQVKSAVEQYEKYHELHGGLGCGMWNWGPFKRNCQIQNFASKLLLISRVSGNKVLLLPWMASTSGAIRCFDTVSPSQKLSLPQHALRPILLHVLMWDSKSDVPARPHEPFSPQQPFPAFAELLQQNSFACIEQPVQAEGEPGIMHGRDTAGDTSFRFHNFSLPNNWV